MAVSKIAKINIIADSRYFQQITESLHDLGVIQIENGDQKIHSTDSFNANLLNEKISKLDGRLANIKFALNFLAPYEAKPQKPLEKMLKPKIFAADSEIKKILNNFDFEKIANKSQEIESRLNFINSETANLKNEINLITPWEKLPYPTGAELKNFEIKNLIIPENLYENFIHSLNATIKQSVFYKVNNENKKIYLSIIFEKEQGKKFEKIINQNIKLAELPKLEKNVSQRIGEIQQEIENLENEKIKLISDAIGLSQNLKNLKILYDYLNWEKNRIENYSKFIYTNYTFSVNGWIKEADLPRLEKNLNKITKNYFIFRQNIEKSDDVPVAFENKKAFSPFEMVTGIYGAPSYQDPDPTPFLAPFFIFFFGVCLTDAGYGIILLIVSLLALKFLKPGETIKKLFQVLAIGGVITFLTGAIFGGWFGIVLDDLPVGAIKNLLIRIRIIDPMAEPLKMLGIVFVFGIIHLLFGISVKAWWNIKNNRLKEALMDQISWILLICSIITFALAKANIFSPNVLNISKYAVYALAVFMILTQGRKAKNFFIKIGSGALSLYSVVGFVSDVLSYSRLLALGLATGIIAMVINIIAMLARDTIPYLGWFLMVLVLIGGHIFNIVINALGAFIHSGRLQFVEFFPKFLEDTGRNFKPFAKESVYIAINNNGNNKINN